jgi:hypothetical protein
MQVMHHLRSLHARHFGIVAATALKSICGGHLQYHDLPTEFHKNLPFSPDTQTGS